MWWKEERGQTKRRLQGMLRQIIRHFSDMKGTKGQSQSEWSFLQMGRTIYWLQRQALLKQKSNEFIAFLASQRTWGTESEIDISLRGMWEKNIKKRLGYAEQVPKIRPVTLKKNPGAEITHNKYIII